MSASRLPADEVWRRSFVLVSVEQNCSPASNPTPISLTLLSTDEMVDMIDSMLENSLLNFKPGQDPTANSGVNVYDPVRRLQLGPMPAQPPTAFFRKRSNSFA